jgi:flagellar basal-body rod modification protein FlgD
MPQMGRPISREEARYQKIQMAKKTNARNQDEAERKIRGKLLNDLTGFVPENKVKNIKNPGQMGKDEFLKLLTHQLQNQDPLNPMDQSKMTGELAQFSQLEQLANLNTKFEKVSQNDAIEAKFYGAGFVGKEVVTQGNSLSLGESGRADVLFHLPQEAARVMVRVHDSKNNIVGQVWKENIGRGNQTFTWDGIGLDGSRQPAGEYYVSVAAWDNGNNQIKAETKATGVVESVFFENGETVLKVDGRKVFLRDVDSFHLPGTKNRQLNRNAQNLPSAQSLKNELRSNSNINKPQALNSYKAQASGEPTTGLTSVYDE